MIPGEYICAEGGVQCNAGRAVKVLAVANTGDRPIQVGSHYHFFEANSQLAFNREAALGMRLDIPSGTAIRFEPGEEMTVPLVQMAGSMYIQGFQCKCNGPVEQGER